MNICTLKKSGQRACADGSTKNYPTPSEEKLHVALRNAILILILGFTSYFSSVSGFLWLNVMCFDLWWTFGGYGSIRRSGMQDDQKKLFWYSVYVWGVSVVMTAICIGMEFHPSLPESLIRPGFTSIFSGCWFDSYESAALYCFGPQGLIIFSNTCLFISTSIKIFQHEKNTRCAFGSGDTRRHNHNKQWFSLHLKLFVVMGVFWLTDTVSWLWQGPKYFWLVPDLVNSLQGILIFLIFVCKKNVRLSLKKRYGYKKLRATCCQGLGPFFTSRYHADGSQSGADNSDPKGVAAEVNTQESC